MIHPRQDIACQVKHIVSEKLHVPEASLGLDSSFLALGADSLGVLTLTLTLEEAFDIEIDDESVEKLRTVGQAVDYIEFYTARVREGVRACRGETGPRGRAIWESSPR